MEPLTQRVLVAELDIPDGIALLRQRQRKSVMGSTSKRSTEEATSASGSLADGVVSERKHKRDDHVVVPASAGESLCSSRRRRSGA
jgi:hypothetical protein